MVSGTPKTAIVLAAMSGAAGGGAAASCSAPSEALGAGEVPGGRGPASARLVAVVLLPVALDSSTVKIRFRYASLSKLEIAASASSLVRMTMKG